MLQLRLEAHDVPQRAEGIVLTSCTTAHGFDRRFVRDRAGRPASSAKAQGSRSAGGNHLDGLAAVEVGRVVLPLVNSVLSPASSPGDEGVVFVLVQRAVEIVGAVAGRPALS